MIEKLSIMCSFTFCLQRSGRTAPIFFYVGPPKEDIFSDHLLWSIFQSMGKYKSVKLRQTSVLSFISRGIIS